MLRLLEERGFDVKLRMSGMKLGKGEAEKANHSLGTIENLIEKKKDVTKK